MQECSDGSDEQDCGKYCLLWCENYFNNYQPLRFWDKRLGMPKICKNMCMTRKCHNQRPQTGGTEAFY